MTVRDIVAEPLLAFGLATGKEVDARVKELMSLVASTLTLSSLPHEFSGGQRQRIGIARPGIEPGFHCLR